MKKQHVTSISMAPPPVGHFSPLMKIFNLLSLVLGHNFDMKVIKASAGLEFEDRRDTSLRIVAFTLLCGSYPVAMVVWIMISGYR